MLDDIAQLRCKQLQIIKAQISGSVYFALTGYFLRFSDDFLLPTAESSTGIESDCS